MNTRTTLGLRAGAERGEPADDGARSRRLKAATHEAHEALDRCIMTAQPFAHRESYARFLRMQYRFHRDLDALYADTRLTGAIPDLRGRNRMESVAADLCDLHIPIPALDEMNVLPASIEWPAGLGWLYVAEGSRLGAAILLKRAADLGFSEQFGARHLAGHPDGRARHWREFTVALDSLSLSPSEEQDVIAGARAAFDRVRVHAARELGG